MVENTTYSSSGAKCQFLHWGATPTGARGDKHQCNAGKAQFLDIAEHIDSVVPALRRMSQSDSNFNCLLLT